MRSGNFQEIYRVSGYQQFQIILKKYGLPTAWIEDKVLEEGLDKDLKISVDDHNIDKILESEISSVNLWDLILSITTEEKKYSDKDKTYIKSWHYWLNWLMSKKIATLSPFNLTNTP